MLWYDGFRGDEIENIGVELNFPDDDDETERERERMNKEIEHGWREGVRRIQSERVFTSLEMREGNV